MHYDAGSVVVARFRGSPSLPAGGGAKRLSLLFIKGWGTPDDGLTKRIHQNIVRNEPKHSKAKQYKVIEIVV